jgi:hypothetical protein
MQELIGDAEDHRSSEARRESVSSNKVQVPDKIDAILMVERATGNSNMLMQTFKKLAKIFLTIEMKESILVMLTDIKAAHEKNVQGRIASAQKLNFAGIVPWESKGEYEGDSLKALSRDDHRKQVKDFFS